MPFAQEGRPAAPTRRPRRRPRRSAARRRPAQRAEAEQAALEQLKEENPEAYAKPEPEEGEEGEEGDEAPRREPSGGDAESSSRRGEFRTDGKDFTEGPAAPQAQVQDPRATTAAAAAAGRAPYYRKFGLCRICLREAAHKGYVPGMTKSSW